MKSVFPVGTVLNTCGEINDSVTPVLSEVKLRYPARLNAMALDPSQIDVKNDGVYTPGEVIFSINIFKDVYVRVRKDNHLVISEKSPRPQLIRHAALLMKRALHVEDGFDIDVQSNDLKHCGLGSSSGLIASVASAINEIYGNPISPTGLVRYLAQNHGEEIDDNDELLQHVQCIGGSAASGLIRGGMKILAGQSVPIASMDIDSSYTVLIGIPEDFVAPDALTLMELEVANMNNFVKTGDAYRDKIGYRVTHEVLPAMVEGKLREASRLLFDYRFDYGSIRNCSFVYPRVNTIAENIRYLYEDGIVDTLALSSVGPAFFAITKDSKACKDAFLENELEVMETHIVNDGYEVTESQPCESQLTKII